MCYRRRNAAEGGGQMTIRPRIPPLGALRAFEAAARLLSFRAAADELGVTQSAISHQIAAIEAFLKVKLFARSPGRVELTDAGVLYYLYLRDAFEKIVRGTALISRLGTTGDLVVETYITVVVRWLIPRLPAFRQANPDLTIRFGTSQLDWELNIDTADVGIIQTRRPDRAALRYTPLHKARLMTVCAPAVAERLAGGTDAERIRHVSRLVVYTAPDDWPLWLDAGGMAADEPAATLQFDSYLLAIEAAIDGQGIAVAPDFLVAGDLAAGRLVSPFARRVEQPEQWFMICRKERFSDPRIRRFEQWLSAQFAERAAAVAQST